MNIKVIAENKKGLFNHEILEKWNAGIKLTGPEVKMAKQGQFNLTGSYIKTFLNPKTKSTEVWLVNAHIPRYNKAGYTQNSYDPLRDRKLLLTKKEIGSITGKIKQRGLTILPILVYNSRSLIKLEIGLAKGKKLFDKRESIKKREFERRKQQLVR